MKVAVNFSIDISKLDESRYVPGKNGAKYADLTCFISPEEPDQYGQHGGIQQSTTKDERDAGTKMPYVGNVTAFWGEGVNIVKGESGSSAPQFTPAPKAPQPIKQAEFDEEIPF